MIHIPTPLSEIYVCRHTHKKKKNTYSIVCAKEFLSLQTYTYHHCFWRIQMVRRDRSPFVKPHTTRSPCWALYLLTWLQNEVLCITRLCAKSKFWSKKTIKVSSFHVLSILPPYAKNTQTSFLVLFEIFVHKIEPTETYDTN